MRSGQFLTSIAVPDRVAVGNSGRFAVGAQSFGRPSEAGT